MAYYTLQESIIPGIKKCFSTTSRILPSSVNNTLMSLKELHLPSWRWKLPSALLSLCDMVKLLMEELLNKNKVMSYVQESSYTTEDALIGEIRVQDPSHNRVAEFVASLKAQERRP